ncbi:MAG TPA: methyltransferase [Ktedonobacterales bacterium]
MPESDATAEGWTEAASAKFIDMADVYVPMREEQMRTLVELIPARADESFTVVELGAGGGALAGAVLVAFPRCRYVALDGSEVMRQRLGEVLGAYSERVEIRDFELADGAWRAALPGSIRCVVSSLVVHHLDGEGKRALFGDLAACIEPGGALLLADIVEAPVPQARALFARQWDDAARAQSLVLAGDLSAYERFQADAWNFYTPEGDDPMDKPSRLFDQLTWLREAGFELADCFWMYAGHAIYGGYR